jgi:hypothetical protein
MENRKDVSAGSPLGYCVRRVPLATWGLLTVVMLGITGLACAAPDKVQQSPLEAIDARLPKTYAAEPVHANVVEEQTGFSLEGVHVVARWELSHIVGGNLPSLAVQETTTDAKGAFFIPGFAQRLRPTGAALTANSPQLILFKPGFVPLRLRNEPKETFVKRFPNYKSMSTKDINAAMEVDGVPERPVQSSFWNNMTIGLEVFNGSESEWLTELATVINGIRDDEGAFVASMLTALKAERGRFNVRKLSDSERRHLGALFLRLDRLSQPKSPR